jgi:hypothetical protein
VGPHKTATTTLQEVLLRNRALLQQEFDVVYPEPLTKRRGHHELPWLVQGWSSEFLEKGLSFPPLEELLTRYLTDDSRACSNVLVSSEDMSTLNDDQWKLLLRAVADHKSPRAPKSVIFLVTYRRGKEWAQSMYSTLLRLGMKQDFREVKRALYETHRTTYKRLGNLANLSPVPANVVTLNYGSTDFLERWFEAVVPGFWSSAGIKRVSGINKSLNKMEQSALRGWNLVHGVDFDPHRLLHWPEFHTATSISKQRAQVRKVLSIFR